MAADPEPACTNRRSSQLRSALFCSATTAAPASRPADCCFRRESAALDQSRRERKTGSSQTCSAGATSISCVTPRHLSCAAGRAPPPRTVRPALPMQLQGLPSLARRHVWLQADLGPLTPACRQSSAQHDFADPLVALSAWEVVELDGVSGLTREFAYPRCPAVDLWPPSPIARNRIAIMLGRRPNL